MGFIIEGKGIHVELRRESFYIAKSQIQHQLFDLIELGYDNLLELERLVKEVKGSHRFRDWNGR